MGVSFSYGKALQKTCIVTWMGKAEKDAKAQEALKNRSKANSEATKGTYVQGLRFGRRRRQCPDGWRRVLDAKKMRGKCVPSLSSYQLFFVLGGALGCDPWSVRGGFS